MVRISSSIRSFGPAVAVAAVLAGASALTQAQELSALAPRQHGPVSIRHTRDDGTADSTNWSGYAVTGATGSVTSVSGSWVVPASTCGAKSSAEYASFWIGIDGWTSSTVEQIGTDSDCSRGTPSYYAWYEFYPNPAYYAGALTNLTPGHVMSATVSYNAVNGEFTAKITDQSDPTLTFTTTFAPPPPSRRRNSLPPVQLSSAEWIAEAPCCARNGDVLPLANFGTVLFGDSTSISGSGTCSATVNGTSGTIGSFGASGWFQTTMVNEKTDAPMATPSSLTPDGGGFSVTWDSVGP